MISHSALAIPRYPASRHERSHGRFVRQDGAESHTERWDQYCTSSCAALRLRSTLGRYGAEADGWRTHNESHPPQRIDTLGYAQGSGILGSTLWLITDPCVGPSGGVHGWVVRTEPESLRNWFTSSQPHSSGPRLSGVRYRASMAVCSSMVLASGFGVSSGQRTRMIAGPSGCIRTEPGPVIVK